MRRPARTRPVSRVAASELADAVPARRLERAETMLAEATRAYERDRYGDALTLLHQLGREGAKVAAVRELTGLTFYRLGRWREALRELSAYAQMSGSVDQHPVLMDAERALGRHQRVAELFAELRRAGASSDVLAEGRIVMSGDLADQGDLASAVNLLAPAASRPLENPASRHVRQWFALGDLYERCGDLPKARELFRRVLASDPELSDAAERLAALR